MDKFNNIGLDKIITSVYDWGGFNTQEAWCKFAQKINIIIEHFNYLESKFNNQKELIDKKLEYLLGEGLSEQVAKQILIKISDGSIADLINKIIFKDLNDKIEANKTNIENNKNTIEQNKNEFNNKINDLTLNKIDIIVTENPPEIGDRKAKTFYFKITDKQTVTQQNCNVKVSPNMGIKLT